MKMSKKIVSLGAAALIAGTLTITAFAASTYDSPSEAVAGLSGRTVESVISERAETSKTGTIAKEAGVLEEFKNEKLEMKKDVLAEKVADGLMTQEKADSIIAAIKENQANCDGTGSKLGQKMGAGFGFGKGDGQGQRQGKGNGQKGQGRNGTGCGQGSCINPDYAD